MKKLMKLQSKAALRGGFTLIEVLIALVLISLVGVILFGSVTSSYSMSNKLADLPELYYTAQGNIESGLDELDVLLKEKYSILNEDVQSPKLQANLSQRLAELDTKIEALCGAPSRTVTLFEKKLDVYGFTRGCAIDGVGDFSVYAGIVNDVRLEIPVPFISSFTIDESGHNSRTSPITILPSGSGKVLTSFEPEYLEKNREYLKETKYQWYVSNGSFHTLYYSDGTTGPEEIQRGTLLAAFPNDFDALSGECTSKLTLTGDVYNKCVGKFVLCTATPVSKQGGGKRGSPAVSNIIYIDDRPALSAGDYYVILDPSLLSLEYSSTGQTTISRLENMGIGNEANKESGLEVESGPAPYIDLKGDATYYQSFNKAYTRYISFDASTVMKSYNIVPKAQEHIFFVVRNREDHDIGFATVHGNSVGLNNNALATAKGGETGWQIVYAEFPNNLSYFTLGGGAFDLAEIMIVRKASSTEINNIIKYLRDKYSIDDTSLVTEEERVDGYLYAIDDVGTLENADGHLVDNYGRLINEYGHLVDEHDNLINEAGHLVDEQDRLINEAGHLVDKFDRLVDEDGNLVDEDGNILTPPEDPGTPEEPVTPEVPEMPDVPETP